MADELEVITFTNLSDAEAYIGEQAVNMQRAYLNVGAAMQVVRDQKLFREKADTWESYCPMAIPGKSWQYDHTAANRLINASAQARALPPGTPIPTRESHLRALRGITDDPVEQAHILELAATIGGISTTTIKAAAATLETSGATGGLVPTVSGETMTNATAAASIEAAETARRQQQHILDAMKRKDELAGRVNVLSNVEIVLNSANGAAGVLTITMSPERATDMIRAMRSKPGPGVKFWLSLWHAAPPDEQGGKDE